MPKFLESQDLSLSRHLSDPKVGIDRCWKELSGENRVSVELSSTRVEEDREKCFLPDTVSSFFSSHVGYHVISDRSKFPNFPLINEFQLDIWKVVEA